MTKTIKTYLPDDLAALATKKAKAQKMSLSSYIQSLIKADTRKQKDTAVQNEEAEDSAGSDDQKIRITVTGNDADLLRKKSYALGISPTAWVRNVINTKTFNVINFSMVDLDEFLKIYDRHVNLIYGELKACADNRKDVADALRYMARYQYKISELFQKQFADAYKTRQYIFRQLVRKYERRDLNEH
ncbi:MAG: hypothetical protein K6E16_04995 [Lachnospiraceae bacterium]|nr:hypothetical protein [Lachnospiraceae bacterium]